MINFNQITKLLSDFNGKFINDFNFKNIENIKSINNADETSLVFIDSKSKNKEDLLSNTKAVTIICDFIPFNETIYSTKCLIVVNNPKLFFTKLVKQQLSTFIPQVHSSAIISASANIAVSCYIGPHVVIGENVKIGENTFIHSNSSIYDNVKIGNNVTIDAGCVIGAAGFGFVRDDVTGEPTMFPQLGSVVIEDDVEIGANVCIDRGALQDTIIRKGVKIDNLVQIAHNVEIGKYTYIIASTIIAGSVKIGERCWIAPSKIINKINIGDDTFIGFGSVVLKSVPANTTLMGYPAKDTEKFFRIQYKLNKM